jgi:hypothetical protein
MQKSSALPMPSLGLQPNIPTTSHRSHKSAKILPISGIHNDKDEMLELVNKMQMFKIAVKKINT